VPGLHPALLSLAVLASCASPAPAPEPTPAPSQLDACPTDLSGAWGHAEDDGFRYQARDDGGVLVLEVRRTPSDGGLEPRAELVLHRSAAGFVGAVSVPRPSADGGCVARFPAEVVSCADGGLVVATVARLRVDGACQPIGNPERRVHRLVRLAPDAG
jgi:hypothetical protein